MKISLATASFFLILCLEGCDILYPPIKVQFADTTITAPNGSFVLYGTVWQTPLDSATLVRLRSEGYTGSTDKAPVAGAELTASSGDTKLTASSDRLGRYVFVLKNSGTFSITAKSYSTIASEPISLEIKSSTQKDITLRPAKEFVLPLAIGNKWIYNYYDDQIFPSSPGRRKGIETWEIVRQNIISNQNSFVVQITGSGTEGTAPQIVRSYSYSYTDTIKVTSSIIFFNYTNHSINRFAASLIDTLKIDNSGASLNSYARYINKLGLYSYSNSGSRVSWGIQLQSYTLK